MGWKGTLRSMHAQQVRMEKYHRQLEKERYLEYSRQAAYDQQQYLSKIRSFHKSQVEEIDWQKYVTAPEPQRPEKTNLNESKATVRYENYSPNFFIKLLRLVNWRKNWLKRNIEKEKKRDESIFQAKLEKYNQSHSDWSRLKERAQKITSNDLNEMGEVVKEHGLLGNIIFDGHLSLTLKADLLDIEIDILEMQKVVPKESRTLLKSGKLSEKEFPKTQSNQLYQDYVCSAVLKAGSDLLRTFPISGIIVTAMCELLNTANGHLERQPLVSVFIPKDSLRKIDIEKVDASDAMVNFNCNMNFKNTSGFSPTKKINMDSGAA